MFLFLFIYLAGLRGGGGVFVLIESDIKFSHGANMGKCNISWTVLFSLV